MDRPVISNVASDSGFDVETEVRPFGSRSGWKQDADLALLHRRFPGHCPYHLLHNLLQLHYSQWPRAHNISLHPSTLIPVGGSARC